MADTLNPARGDALLYRTLATLRTDVPIPQDLNDLRWAEVDRPRLTEFCERVQDRRFAARVLGNA